MKIIIILILFLFGTNIGFGQNWEYKGEMQKPVAGGAIWNDYENIYILGGYSDSVQNNVNWYQTYFPFSETWNIDTISTARYGLVANFYNGSTYYFGGSNSDARTLIGINKIENSPTDGVTINKDINFNRNFSNGHIINGKYYIIGGNPQPGTQTDTIPYIIEYGLEDTTISYTTDSLFTDGELPEQQMSAAIGNDIFIFGGVINGVSKDIYKFNVISKSYEKLEIELLEPRAGGQVVNSEFSNSIYIIGGYNENSAALNSVEIFTVSENNHDIFNAEPINDARYNFMASYLYDKIYIFGGFDADNNVVKSIEIYNGEVATDIAIDELEALTDQYNLYQNYPNPFNPLTNIKFTIPTSEIISFVELKIYDVIGNEIATLVSKNIAPGNYEVQFDATKQPSGVYYYQLKSNSFIQTKKMILLK